MIPFGGVDLENIMKAKSIFRFLNKEKVSEVEVKNLTQAKINKEYIVKDIKTDDEELKNFLFTLGCYEGEVVTVISVLAENYIINVKEARYSIDKDLAKAIII